MITVVSDTHSRDTHQLSGHALTAVREADLVVHAGDFTTESVLDAFEAESTRFIGVAGNSDSLAIRERLPATRTVEHGGLRVALTHGHNHSETALSLLARQERADLLVVGHSHVPTIRPIGDCTLLNPGSHAEPRGHRPGFATLRAGDDGFVGRLLELDGTVFEEFTISI